MGLEIQEFKKSEFCLSLNKIMEYNVLSKYDYLLEHINHLDTQLRENTIRVQGLISPNNLLIGMEEMGSSKDLTLKYVQGYYLITFSIYL